MSGTFLQIFEGNYFRVKGIPYHSLLANKDSIENLFDYADVREDDVIVWTFPKSGTHAVLDIAWKIAFNGDLEKYATEAGELWFEVTLIDGMMTHNPAVKSPKSLEELSRAPSPRVIATHLGFSQLPKQAQDGKCKIIYVSRNPKDVLVSLYEMTNHLLRLVGKEPCPWTLYLQGFTSEEIFYGSWARHIKDFYSVKDRPNVLWIKYEDLIKDYRGHVKRIQDFLGKSLDDDTVAAIAESSTFDSAVKQFPGSTFLRKGKSGGWKERFTVAESEFFDEKMRQELGDISAEVLN